MVGRTSPARLFAEFDNDSNEWIRYVDFTSLYPFVQKTCDYPVGLPDEIYGSRLPTEIDFMNRHEDYFGLVYLDVIPPNNLLFPILPVKMDNKLIFPLCYTCAKEKNPNGECRHSEEERKLTRKVYCTPELGYAIRNGYKVSKLYEIWHFKKMSANGPGNGLFGDFITQAVKGKQEASGFPAHVQTEDEKQQFIESYFQATGILLSKDDVVKNPGLRFIFKLICNSLWGKFAQRNDRSHVEFVHTYDELAKLIQDRAQVVIKKLCMQHLSLDKCHTPISLLII